MTTLYKHPAKTVALAIVALLLAGTGAADAQTDNAALLYYQACLLYGQPDETLAQMLTDFRDGKIASNEPIRKHIEANLRVIEYVVKASDLPRCDWGYDYSQGLDLTLVHLSSIKRIAFLVAANARLYAEQGDYRTALDRCMMVHKMALQETDRMAVTYLMGVAMSAMANSTIQNLLIGISRDVGALNQTEAQLSQTQDAFPSLQYVITQEGQVLAASIRKEKAQDRVRDMAQEDVDTTAACARILAGDDAFFQRNRSHWLNAISSIVAVLDSKLPYTQTRSKLDELDAQITESAKTNPDATFTGLLLPAISRIYGLSTRLQGHFNALRAATELYAIRARTGQLPDVLPADAPTDPFSGQAFVYEKANDHFTLRCSEKEEPAKAEANAYEFKLGQ
ncbi:MAG: hypothetical protein JW955_08570 [Sedimentisphaerales bacterium]|nr:hypothetical protein [Sedimentisphaerales bacterium]